MTRIRQKPRFEVDLVLSFVSGAQGTSFSFLAIRESVTIT